jgi:hypothetical protein
MSKIRLWHHSSFCPRSIIGAADVTSLTADSLTHLLLLLLLLAPAACTCCCCCMPLLLCAQVHGHS